jgi:hypothetical protein
MHVFDKKVFTCVLVFVQVSYYGKLPLIVDCRHNSMMLLMIVAACGIEVRVKRLRNLAVYSKQLKHFNKRMQKNACHFPPMH